MFRMVSITILMTFAMIFVSMGGVALSMSAVNSERTPLILVGYLMVPVTIIAGLFVLQRIANFWADYFEAQESSVPRDNP